MRFDLDLTWTFDTLLKADDFQNTCEELILLYTINKAVFNWQRSTYFESNGSVVLPN